MKKLLFAAVVAFGTTGCLSAVDLCKEGAKVSCQRAYECFDAATKADPAFVAIYGASETECVSKLTSLSCATVTNDKPCQDSSKKYDGQKASACIQDIKAASCATITGNTFASGNCDNTCS